MYIYTIINLLIRMFALASIGFFLKKIKLIDDKIQQGLSKLLVTVFLPASILSFAANPFEADMANELAVTGIVSIIYFGITALVLFFLLRKIPNKMSHDKQNIFLSLVLFGNTAFLGYPIIINLLGQKAMIIAVIFNIVWNFFFFTMGISIIKGENSVSFLSIIKNPATISSILTLIIYLSPFRLPIIANTILTDLGNIVTPISMMLIGAALNDITFKSIVKDAASILIAIIRLLIIPVLGIFILRVLNVPDLTYQTIVLLLAMPSASMVVIQASLFENETNFATRSISLNTVLFAFTFPLILFLMNLTF